MATYEERTNRIARNAERSPSNRDLSGHLGCIFIDFENFLLALVNTYGHSPADAQSKTLSIIGQTEKFLGSQGVQIVLRRAYVDWSQYPDAMKELYRMGVQTVNVGATPRKNSADIELSLSLQEVMLGRTNIDVLVVMAGDRDYMPITIRAEEQAKSLLFISFKDSLSGDLKALVGPQAYFYVEPRTGNIVTGAGNAETVSGVEPSLTVKGKPGKELTEQEMKALHAAIRAYNEYQPKYGDVKLSGFLVDGLSRVLPSLSHLERKQVFTALQKKGLVHTNMKMSIYGDPFVVFSIDETNPLVKNERSKIVENEIA
jgi:hypothetical protein